MNVASLMAAQYADKTYTCAHFASEAWEVLTGLPSPPLVEALHDSSTVVSTFRRAVEVAVPTQPCFVVMRGAVHAHHVGVWYEGRVLHLRRTGPHYATVAALRREYGKLRFFEWRA